MEVLKFPKLNESPNTFLRISGIILVLLGLAGAYNLFSIDVGEAITAWSARAGLGAVMIVASLTIPARDQRRLTMFLGATTAVYVVITAFMSVHTGTPLSLTDYVINTLFAVWALAAGGRRNKVLAAETHLRA